MSWEDIVKEKGACAVEVCRATTCRSNEDMHCVLDVVNVSPTGQCEMFVKEDTNKVRAKTGGDKSFIERARLANQGQKESEKDRTYYDSIKDTWLKEVR